MSEPSRPVKKRALVAWVNEQIQHGAPRWPLYLNLSKMQSESEDINEMQVLAEVLDSLEGQLVDRNLKGIELEKQGDEEQAIALYEANVADRFDGSHPYERLRIMYTYRKKYKDAIRICEAYISHGQQDPKVKEKYAQVMKDLSTRLNEH